MTSFRRVWTVLAVGLAIFAMNGCAIEGERYAEMAQLQRDPAPGMARIYIYRKSLKGALVQPTVEVNGKAIGQALADGFFFVEGTAGVYKISVDGDMDHAVTVNAPAGQVRYVRIDVSMRLLNGGSSLVPVGADEGGKDIQNCRHLSQKL